MPLRDQQPSKYFNQELKLKSCSKFQRSKSSKEISSSRAIIFNSLRQHGCDKKQAITFCTKNVCKFDSTKMTDGPRNFRILKVKAEKDKILNGWYQQQPCYIMQDKCVQSVNDFVKQQDEEIDQFQQQFEKRQSKTHQEYREKIENIQKYYKELNQKYSLQTESHEELKNRIKQFRTDLANKQQQCYMANGNMKLYGLGEQVRLHQKNQNNLIQQAQVFNYLGVDVKQVLEDKDYNFIDNRHDDELYQQVLNKEYEKNSSHWKEISQKSSRSRKNTEIEDTKLMNQKYMNLLSKSKILSNMAQFEEYSDDQKASLISKQLKKRNQNIKQVDQTEQIKQIFKDKQQSKLLEKEFNSSKYVTQKIKRTQSQDLGSNRILETQLKQFIQDQIKNLHSDQQIGISQQQLKDMIQKRTDYKRSYTRKTSSVGNNRTTKINNRTFANGLKNTQLQIIQYSKSQSQHQPVKYQNFTHQQEKTTQSFYTNQKQQSQNQSDDHQDSLQKIKLKDIE